MGPGVSPAPKHQINEYESAIVDKLYFGFLKEQYHKEESVEGGAARHPPPRDLEMQSCGVRPAARRARLLLQQKLLDRPPP